MLNITDKNISSTLSNWLISVNRFRGNSFKSELISFEFELFSKLDIRLNLLSLSSSLLFKLKNLDIPTVTASVPNITPAPTNSLVAGVPPICCMALRPATAPVAEEIAAATLLTLSLLKDTLILGVFTLTVPSLTVPENVGLILTFSDLSPLELAPPSEGVEPSPLF